MTAFRPQHPAPTKKESIEIWKRMPRRPPGLRLIWPIDAAKWNWILCS
jgi:hypothetical protein